MAAARDGVVARVALFSRAARHDQDDQDERVDALGRRRCWIFSRFFGVIELVTALFHFGTLGTSVLLSTFVFGSSSGCDCHGGEDASRRRRFERSEVNSQDPGHRDLGRDRRGPKSSLIPARREPGPRRPETAAEIAAERRRARAFTSMLLKSLNRREVTALADIRGYRLYKRRYFGRAHTWFLAAVATDPRFELSLYNAARTAALLGRLAEAQALLSRLARLKTPLARQRLRMARTDPDLEGLRTSRSGVHRRSRSKERIAPVDTSP